ncbi:acetamidase/formamidase family protein [Mycobacterium montefiorense]|uniref:Acetamidase n=1 Tax=Mycobacterium montefiorense TaxID=154654 RepID=A0AA37PNT8_9MYCO|nr:acetamidase/formamidase family protein [Mycobacterium montefiorense]GBG37726.1 acetamidase [Mycobacterium montefiorense]GKU34864.1 acetamidase [Mycobacterium montefiorense]GKU40877.1 acetamidase [Mycobacterium montefiorense]GKU46986.1 acetamidase [Mycobacterium montefiorense]GKU49106.1 acetamidase [Mycobacterium montefiorense]
MDQSFGQSARDTLVEGVGRRDFVRAVAAIGAGVGVVGIAAGCTRTGAAASTLGVPRILQPGEGNLVANHYLQSTPDQVLWGYVPNVHAKPVLRMKSGETITIDTVSHEGILEDQGRNPVAYFGSNGVPQSDVLADAIAIAAEYRRTPRDFDKDGPHVVTGPVFVEGAQPGDVLKIETLEAIPRVPYGVVSSRHGKGALARTPDGKAPAGIALGEVMPPVSQDHRPNPDSTKYGNSFTFTAIEEGHGVMRYGKASVRFGLNPFMGMMGVAFSQDSDLTAASANSIPPTLGGGNIDIRLLGVGSTFYLPVFAEGALFYAGDPHHAMGSGEVALTAMEGSLRGTFRLTVCKPKSGDAPSVAFRYPFAETADLWVPIGLSDPDASVNGQINDLNVAMRRAVVNALDFLETDRGMDRATAYAYLSAAADFSVSQVVDRTVGVHAQIDKSHFK